MSISFTKLGKFSFIIFFLNRFPISRSVSSPSSTPYDVNVGTLEVVPEAAYAILVLLDFFFLLVVLLDLFLLPYVLNH